MLFGLEGLRNLIDDLEERYQRLSTESFAAHPDNTAKINVQFLSESRDTPRQRAALEHVDRYHDSLVELVEIVKYERRSLRQAQRHEENYGRPAYRLPPEVPSSIFEQACLPNTSLSGLPLVYKTLYAITWSCRNWRRVAIETSSLWTSWLLSTSPSSSKAPYFHHLLLREFISRAKERPLRLLLVLNDAPNPELESLLGDAFSQAEVLDIKISRTNVSGWFEGYRSRNNHGGFRYHAWKPKQLTQLRKLIMHDIDGLGDMYRHLLQAPNLSSLQLDMDPHVVTNLQLPNTYHGLHHLCLINVYHQVPETLSKCPQLETLVWHGPKKTIMRFNGNAYLPNLVRLSLNESTSRFLHHIDTPRLQKLHLQPLPDQPYPTYSQLTTLELVGGGDERGFKDFLLRHPDLETITMVYACEAVLDALGTLQIAPDGTEQCHFTNLSAIKAPVDVYEDDVANICTLFRRRMTALSPSTSKKLEFHVLGEVDQRALKELREKVGDQIVHQPNWINISKRWGSSDYIRGDEWLDCFH